MVKIFNIFGEPYEVDFEIYIGDKLAQKQSMQAPKEILMINFIQTANQIGNDRRPMKIKMIRQEIIFDNFENKQKTLNNEVSFSNNAMVAYENDKEKEKNV